MSGVRERNLDALLEDWAGRNALPPGRAEAIRYAILQSRQANPTELSVAWWNRLFQPLDAVLRQAMDMSRYLQLQ